MGVAGKERLKKDRAAGAGFGYDNRYMVGKGEGVVDEYSKVCGRGGGGYC